MKRLIAPLVLAAVVGATLFITTGGDDRTTGAANTAGTAVPALSIARLDGGAPSSSRRSKAPTDQRCCGSGRPGARSATTRPP